MRFIFRLCFIMFSGFINKIFQIKSNQNFRDILSSVSKTEVIYTKSVLDQGLRLVA